MAEEPVQGSVTAPERDETTEVEVVKRRLATAGSIPAAIVILLLTMVLFVAISLVEVHELTAWLPAVLALVIALAILGVATRGGIREKARLSYRQLLTWILGVGVVFIGGLITFLLLTSGPSVTGPGGTVTVVASPDFKFDRPRYEVPEGEITLDYENTTDLSHTLTVEGHEDDILLEVSSSNREDVGSIGLAAGTYVVYCTIKGHRDQGMEGTLEVKPAPPEGGPPGGEHPGDEGREPDSSGA